MTLGGLRKKVWFFLSEIERWKYNHIYRHDIGKNVIISHRAHLDKGVPGIHIGEGTWVLAEASILNHDVCRGVYTQTYIGKHCVIGSHSIILPGLHIGDMVVVGSGSVVSHSIPDNCIVVGNPARIIKTGVEVKNGRIIKPGKRVSK